MAARTHHRTCNLCEAMCGMALAVEDGRITDIRGDPEDVLSRGHICPKGPAMREIYEDPDRLRRPMKRTKTGWQPISWEAAFTETAERLQAARKQGGRNAIGLYVGNPVVHNHGAMLALVPFTRTLGTRNRFDANSQDANPRLLASLLLYGAQSSLPVPDVDRTDFFLILGANPAASNGSLMSLGDVRGRLAGIRKRGGRIVLIDPRRTETAAWSDEHHFIRPGGDAAFLLALLHVVFAEGRVDAAAVSSVARGLEEIRALVARFPPERVAASVGVAADTIRGIARAFANAPRAVAYGRVGTCTQQFGTLASVLIDVLNVVTGNFDRPGGAMFTTPAVPVGSKKKPGGPLHYDRWRSRVRRAPELGGNLPAAILAEEMETPGEGQIRALITLSGNPVLSTPNGPRLAAALGKLDFMVSVDFYINETTRHAHLILPPTHSLERGHYDLVFHTLSVRNTVKYSEPVFAPPADSHQDWDILYELGMRLGGMRFGNRWLDAAARAAWRAGFKLTPDRLVDFGLRRGPYRLSLSKVRRALHGMDLGALVPGGRAKVPTADGKVQLAADPIVADIARLEKWLSERQNGELVLIGRRHLRTNNSWMHNCRSLVKGKDRATLLISQVDAVRLGLSAGKPARISSRVGSVIVPVEVSDDMMPGVVSLPHGYGHADTGDTLHVASAVAGANINALTDEDLLDPLSGTAALSGVPVTVEPVALA